MDIIILPVSKYVTISSIRIILDCNTCHNVYAKNIFPDDKGEFVVSRGWQVCNICAEKRLAEGVE